MPTGLIDITLTTAGLPDQIRECREQLDRELAKFAAPPAGQVQALRLVGRNGHTVTYELTNRVRVNNEDRTIL